MSIAVLLDSSKKLKPADAASLRKLVSAASGLQTSRGDTLELGQLSFDNSSTEAMATELAMVTAGEQKKAMFDLIKSGLLGFLALMSVFMAYRAAKKANSRIISTIPLDSLPRSSSLALPSLADLQDDEDEGDRPTPAAVGMPLPLAVSPRPDIAALIDQQPGDVANTLREWLADRRS
jgi:flagellar biosynthesis/type III secretory pathway M-ring protein FliF/YscJ